MIVTLDFEETERKGNAFKVKVRYIGDSLREREGWLRITRRGVCRVYVPSLSCEYAMELKNATNNKKTETK
jgi:hypothetical protein